MSVEIVNRTIDILDKEKQTLLDSIKAARRRADALSSFVHVTDDLYSERSNRPYMSLIMGLKEVVGISLQMIIELDSKTQRSQKEQPAPAPPAAVYVGASPQPAQEGGESRGKGIGEYVIEFFKERATRRQEVGPTKILQSIEVFDVLDLGRQALPALNNLLRWHEDNLFHLKVFDTPDARWYFNKREKGYLTRLLNTVTSFLIAAENHSRNKTMQSITQVGEAAAGQLTGGTTSRPAPPNTDQSQLVVRP